MHTLRLTMAQALVMRAHLLAPDGHEAVALALLGLGGSEDRRVFTVHEIHLVPHEDCERSAIAVTWPTRIAKQLMERAGKEGFAVMRIHSHPKGKACHSEQDDRSDRELFDALDLRCKGPHISAVMGADGRIVARLMDGGDIGATIGRVSVVGDELTVWDAAEPTKPRDFDLRHRQAFGDGTADTLSRLSIAIVGISGTGSPVCEMLARLGVGRLVLIDPDKIEPKNLNRIYGAKRADADAGRNKAEMARDRIQEMGLGTKVEIFTGRIDHPDAIRLLSTCDVLFGCMDSVVGRDTLNRTATFYLQPYFDIGVRLDADGEGGVDSVSAAVHYLKPGGSSLKGRGVYDDDQLYAEHLHDTDPEFYEDQRARGYVRGVAVDRPAVISINTAAAAFAVNELLARLHPFRTRPNVEFAIHKLLFSHGRTTCRPDGEPDESLSPYVGRGDCRPLLMCGRLEVEV